MAGKTAENYFLIEVLRFFSASCSTTLAMNSAIALMKAEIADVYIAVMLNDIRDLNNIASTGFQFATRREEDMRWASVRPEKRKLFY